ncbi:MAG: hypothetical protein M1813_001206 [Trichoglossum hirsutum]|nr:MAG: hypothetical protein M1813_001206 [Trichoglossum hirsutum]
MPGSKEPSLKEGGGNGNGTGTPSPVPSVIKESAGLGFTPDWRFKIAFGTLSVVTLVVALDATSLSVALPIISEKLHGTAIQAFWAGTSFLLSSTVFQPSWALLSHIFGRKPLILAALVFFTAGSIISGLAHNFTVMLVGRTIQGVGGGGVIALTEVIVTDLVPLRERGKWFGFISGVWALGSVTGPVIGGAFSQNVSWRWIFWINMPFAGIGFFMIPVFLTLQYKTGDFVEKLKRVDWVGSFIFVASTTSFLIPVTWGGVMYPWSHWRTLVPLILGGAGLVGFIFYEIYVPAEPLIKLHLFKNRSTSATYIGTVLHGMILWSMLYYLPLYYEAVKGYSPIISGVAVFPQTFTVAPMAMIIGFAVAITGYYRWALWTGWVFTVVGTGLLILLDVHTSTPAWIFLNLVPGAGTGILFSAMAYSIQASSPPKDQAFAASLYSFFRAFGQSLGVAIGGVIFQNEMKRRLLRIPEMAAKAIEYSKDSAALVQIIKAMPEDLPTRVQLIKAYAESLKTVWAAMCGFAAVALLFSLLVQHYDLDVQLETEQGYAGKKKVGEEAEEKA